MADLATLAGVLGRRLHAAGVAATPERCGRFAAAVLLAPTDDVRRLYWLARVTLVSGLDELPAFDAVFGQVFRGLVDVAGERGDPAAPVPPVPQAAPAHVRAGGDRRPASVPTPRAGDVPPAAAGTAGGGETGAVEAPFAAASSLEVLRRKDFARASPEELAELHRLVARLRLVAPRRLGRRTRPHRGGARLDLRRTLRLARRTAGDPVRRSLRRRTLRPRRVVLVADVSGSMEPYARVYVQLLQGAVRAARAEAFVFATRLTRLTRALAAGPPDAALSRAAAAAPDWSGGTRIGAALKAFVDGYGRRGVARGAVVVIVSDGWERDDPALLAEQMARLGRLAHRVVWVNPRKAADGYRPLVGGMAAALPYVDTFVSGHSAQALDEVLDAVAADT